MGKKDGKSTPYYFKMKNNDLFAIAGIFTIHIDDNGLSQYQFAVITKDSKLVSEVFHWMIVILNHKDEDKWLDNTVEKELIKIHK